MILLIFPHQLYKDHPGLRGDPERVLLIEDALFFGDLRYPARFHKQKLWLHRATMKRYEAELLVNGHDVGYIEYQCGSISTGNPLERALSNVPAGTQVCCIDPTDFVLEKRLHKACERLELSLQLIPNPGFLNSTRHNSDYRERKRRWYMADYYKWQRQRLNVLMDGVQPKGGQWSFDTSNRKKVPRKSLSNIPSMMSIQHDAIDNDARDHVERRFPDHPGSIERLFYPTSHESASEWLGHFLASRFDLFGDYEDAIVEGESWLWHSVLTPTLNIGLLTPQQVVDETLKYAADHQVSINSLEGFLRQIIGWREFVRATYDDLGVSMRTANYWRHERPMPPSFYNGTTGIAPVDDTIQRILDTGYCHHIERLMVLGGFMFLCEIHPDAVYRWFMKMFVDSYDWVMVPNVYAMSQNADGGQITTKPYFSGSSYVRKMSHYKPGDWCQVWDGLYWRWIANHREELSTNPRWAMMCSMVKKMDSAMLAEHRRHAEAFLEDLSPR